MHAAKLESVDNSADLHVDFSHLRYIDHACLDLLMNWAKQHEGSGGTLSIDWDSLHGRFAEEPKVMQARIRKGSPVAYANSATAPVSQPTDVG